MSRRLDVYFTSCYFERRVSVGDFLYDDDKNDMFNVEDAALINSNKDESIRRLEIHRNFRVLEQFDCVQYLSSSCEICLEREIATPLL